MGRMILGRHSIPQGEGGEQGDAMMPLLFSVGQHEALQVAHWGMWDGEHLMAFLDDVYMASDPDCVGPVFATVQGHLRRLGESGPGTESRLFH